MVLTSLRSIETWASPSQLHTAPSCVLSARSLIITLIYSFSGCLESRLYDTLKTALLIPAKQVHDHDKLMLPAQARTCLYGSQSYQFTCADPEEITPHRYFHEARNTSTFPRLVFPLSNGSRFYKMRPLMGRLCIQYRYPFVPVQSVLTSLW